MRRKRPVEESENLERWLVSYADFITLLFAFFVVMYSVSSVNQGKYRLLSDSIVDAFSKVKQGFTTEGNQQAEHASDVPKEYENLSNEEKEKLMQNQLEAEKMKMVELAETFQEVLEPFVEKELVKLEYNDFVMRLEMKSGMLFESGQAVLSRNAIPILRKLAKVLHHNSNGIQVEGHTDDIPINTPHFPSNWELSSARAASVVRQMVAEGVNPLRLSAVGFGEYRPIADNTFEEGRNENRRVVMVLSSRTLNEYRQQLEEEQKFLDMVPAEPEAEPAETNNEVH
ncbi:MAG: flagellar motor protein MotD [Methylococcaceae bacterium]